MKAFNDHGNTVTGLKELMAKPDTRPDPKTVVEWTKTINEIQTRRFEDGFLKLKAAIAPFLNFHEL